MKVLLVNKLYYPWIGGIEKVTEDLADGLKARGFDVEVLACVPKGKAKEEVRNGIVVHKAASFGILASMPISFDFFWKFKKLASTSDLIFVQHPFPSGTLAYLMFGQKKPLAVWYHSDIERQRVANFFFTPLLSASLRRASKIFVSNSNLVRYSKYLAPFKEKCLVLPFSINLEEFKASPQVLDKAREIRIKFGQPLLLAVGRMVPYKGFEYLIQAMRSVSGKLLIIGKGPLTDKFKEMIREYGIENKVFLLDYADDLIPYYYACDIFVLPSIYKTEAFGLVQLEAMACGKPVINTSLPTGVPEVSIDGETGYTVPPQNVGVLGNAINKIIGDKELNKRFGEAARMRVEKRFSRNVFLDTLEKELNSIH